MGMLKLAVIAALAVLSAGCSPKEFELAGDGRAARIVIPADALESTKLAAKLFSSLLQTRVFSKSSARY